MEAANDQFFNPEPPVTVFICIDSFEGVMRGRMEDLERMVRFRGIEEILRMMNLVIEKKCWFKESSSEKKKSYYVRPGKLCTLQVQFYLAWNGNVQGIICFLGRKTRGECTKVAFRSELELMKLIQEAVAIAKEDLA